MKTLFIVPGFTHSIKQQKYKKIIRAFKKCGYRVIGFQPIWKRSVVSEQAEAFISFCERKKIDLSESAFLGFSFGAVIVLIAAGILKPRELFLCSLSPYFSEDTPDIPERWKKYIGKKRMRDFSGMNSKKMSQQIRSITHIFVEGIELPEGPTVLRRSKVVHKHIPQSTLVVIPEARHDIGQKEYVNAINATINNT